MDKRNQSLTRVEIIRDGEIYYLVTKDGVQSFESSYHGDYPFRLDDAIQMALGVREDDET